MIVTPNLGGPTVKGSDGPTVMGPQGWEQQQIGVPRLWGAAGVKGSTGPQISVHGVPLRLEAASANLGAQLWKPATCLCGAGADQDLGFPLHRQYRTQGSDA